MDRRKFIKNVGIGTTCLLLQSPLKAHSLSSSDLTNQIHFGIVTDVHADMHPDCAQRLQRFISEAEKRKVDFIIQMGDFCRPREIEQGVYDVWNKTALKKFHVLGNHDMDFHTKDITMNHWDMPAPYYSFDVNEYHFIVLDANYLYREGQYIDYANANFYVDSSQRAFINPDQVKWLENDLKNTKKRTIVFSHQSLINVCWGVRNRIEIQEILENTNRNSKFQKVIACFNGHDHIDFHRKVNNIHYIEINGMDYQWLGEKYKNFSRFSDDQYKAREHLSKIAPYKDPLYAFIKVTKNAFAVEGVQSDWLGPSPRDLGMPEQTFGCRYSPSVSSRNIKLDEI